MITKIDIKSTEYKFLYKSLLYANKNNAKISEYKKQGFEILRTKVDNLPDDIAFMPTFMTRRSSCVKILDKIYVFLSKSNLKKSIDEKFDALFHEIGRWLHFQQMPAKEERQAIWSAVEKEKVKETVSERAIQDDDGKEFVAEVFKGLVKGKKYDADTMYIYWLLNGPAVK